MENGPGKGFGQQAWGVKDLKLEDGRKGKNVEIWAKVPWVRVQRGR